MTNDETTIPDHIMLEDDGTMDTVFSCVKCGKMMRYSDVARDKDTGEVLPEAFQEAADDHDNYDKCEVEEDGDES